MGEQNKGKILVIEGTDFSGKTTQYDLLSKRLDAEGFCMATSSFPNYDSESSYMVRAYLGGKFGENAKDIDPKVASLFYAMDRYASYNEREWGAHYREGGNVLFARYISSNILHQASKYATRGARVEFLKWLYDVETGLLGLPKEDRVVFLDMPPEWAQKLKKKRMETAGTSSGGLIDIHEADKDHLYAAYTTAKDTAKLLGWDVVECVVGERLKSVEEIQEEIFNIAINTFVKA